MVTKMSRWRTELLFCPYRRRLGLLARTGCMPLALLEVGSTIPVPAAFSLLWMESATGLPLVLRRRPARASGARTRSAAV